MTWSSGFWGIKVCLAGFRNFDKRLIVVEYIEIGFRKLKLLWE